MFIVTITLPVQIQDNERSCVLLQIHYTTCTKPGKLAVICIAFTWHCTGSVMVSIHMTAHFPDFVQVM
jgi:hypothetical protein